MNFLKIPHMHGFRNSSVPKHAYILMPCSVSFLHKAPCTVDIDQASLCPLRSLGLGRAELLPVAIHLGLLDAVSWLALILPRAADC